jgi:anaerobic selenocysteine-containing dehydrogenase
VADVLSFCRICSATCGVVVTVEAGRVTKVRGDVGHPVSRGYTCPKGRALAQWHHSSPRLDRPRLRGADAPWDAVLDDLGAGLAAAATEGGPDAVGLYTATGLAYDSLGSLFAQRWFAGLGSRQLYSATTIDNAPAVAAAELVTGQSLSTVWEPEGAGLLLLVGTNPVVSHGYGTALPDPIARLREFRAAGGRVWVVDPRRTESAALADRHLAVRPGTDHLVLAALVRELLEDGADESELAAWCAPDDVAALREAVAPFTIPAVAAAAGIAVDGLAALVADVRGRPGRVAALCGTGITMSRHGLLACWLRWVLLVLSGSLDRAGGMRVNPGVLFGSRGRSRPGSTGPGPGSRPELRRWLGQYPCVALVDEIEAGRLRALVIAGGNPLAAFPEAARTEAALRCLDVLAVVDVVDSPLAELATHVLPSTSQLERADVLVQEAIRLRPGTQHTPAVVAPEAERRPTWWVFAHLARRLGADLLDGRDPDGIGDEDLIAELAASRGVDPGALREAGPRGLEVEREYGWVHERVIGDGGHFTLAPPIAVVRLASEAAALGASGTSASPSPALVLTPRREQRSMNSAHYADDPSVPRPARLHPDTLAALGRADGDHACVRSGSGTAAVVLRADEAVRPGAVSIVHGWGAANVADLTSTREGVDAFTGMPQLSGVAIEIDERAP